DRTPRRSADVNSLLELRYSLARGRPRTPPRSTNESLALDERRSPVRGKLPDHGPRTTDLQRL
ncbi:MAG: hypothetical protein WBW88_03395, partial [Rhodothermales bacterium]